VELLTGSGRNLHPLQSKVKYHMEFQPDKHGAESQRVLQPLELNH